MAVGEAPANETKGMDWDGGERAFGRVVVLIGGQIGLRNALEDVMGLMDTKYMS